MAEYGVAAHARVRPDKVAILHGDRSITFGEIDLAIRHAVPVLAAAGVGGDHRLGIALGNRPEWIVAALAAARLGAQVVPIPSGATADEREYFCTDGDVAFLLDESGLPDFLERCAAAGPVVPADDVVDYATLRAYTSGTTGRPKAVLRPPTVPADAIDGMVRYYTGYGLGSPDEVNISASPLHHIAGFSGLHSALIFGHTAVLLDHFDAVEWLDAVARERVTYSWCAPVHLFRLMAVPDAVKEAADVSTVKRVVHGSAPCAPSLKRAVIDFFPAGAVWETYGGTETMGTVITPEEWLRKPGSVGKAAPGSTIKIFPVAGDGDGDGDGDELPTGEIGLVYIGSDWGRGFRYAGPAELTESVYRGNLATLGDLGYLDEDGYLFLADRQKDMVITGGSNVYPAEVEAVLVTLPGVAEVAVIGVPDDEYGEIVTAVVVRGTDPASVALGEADVITFAREHLVRYKAPRRVEFVDQLPRDPMGKVLKRELRTTFS